MKGKMALATALATLVTVGGVYATWTFAESNASSANTTVNVAMTGVNATTEKGTLSVMVMGTNGFTLAVDDADGNHKPDIKKTGVVTVTFTPSSSASTAIQSSGIDVQCVISYAPYNGGPATLDAWTYDNSQIFDIENDSTDPILLSKSAATYDSTTNTFKWVIEADDIGIDLTSDLQAKDIDTLDKYNALNAELAKGHFVLTVSEYVATP